MFQTLKGYLTAGAAALVLLFAVVFKYRGAKIENLQEDIRRKDNEAVVTAKVVASEKKAAQYVADNRVAKEVAENEEINYINTPNSSFYI